MLFTAGGKILLTPMTAAALARLLTLLDEDADRAAAAYEHLRRSIEKFFEWHAAWPPEECADETLDRLTKKVVSETPIDDVRRYAHGIAKLVLLEWQRRPKIVSIDEGHHPATPWPAAEADGDEVLQECFDRCLAALPPESRTLVLEYYVAEQRTKIENRRRLARSLTLSENALRSRVQRVRDRLERCVGACTSSRATAQSQKGQMPRLAKVRDDY
jgi:DNA-directed RNA polymerase specialized sigma24 family protein